MSLVAGSVYLDKAKHVNAKSKCQTNIFVPQKRMKNMEYIYTHLSFVPEIFRKQHVVSLRFTESIYSTLPDTSDMLNIVNGDKKSFISDF